MSNIHPSYIVRKYSIILFILHCALYSLFRMRNYLWILPWPSGSGDSALSSISFCHLYPSRRMDLPDLREGRVRHGWVRCTSHTCFPHLMVGQSMLMLSALLVYNKCQPSLGIFSAICYIPLSM